MYSTYVGIAVDKRYAHTHSQKALLWRLKFRQENTELDFKEVWGRCVLIHVVQNRDSVAALVDMVRKLWVPQTAGNILGTLATISLS